MHFLHNNHVWVELKSMTFLLKVCFLMRKNKLKVMTIFSFRNMGYNADCSNLMITWSQVASFHCIVIIFLSLCVIHNIPIHPML